MIDNEQNFTRYAILGELEKNFVAYEKDLFLHMGTRYIDQRAKSPINNQIIYPNKTKPDNYSLQHKQSSPKKKKLLRIYTKITSIPTGQ